MLTPTKTCPAGEHCPHVTICESAMCTRLHARPVDVMDAPTAVHFVGFRGEEYHSAVRVFGEPDFIHRVYDRRTMTEVAAGDVVVFAKYHDQPPSPYSYDDSNQPGDPAARERLL